MQIIVTDHARLLALTDGGWDLDGEAVEPTTYLKDIPREIEHDCGRPGSHQYNCGDCGWLPF